MLLKKADIENITESNYAEQYEPIKQCVYPKLEKIWNVKLDYSQATLSQPFFLTSDPDGYVNYNAIPKSFDFSSYQKYQPKEKLKRISNSVNKYEHSEGNYSKVNNKYLKIIMDIKNNDPLRLQQLSKFFSNNASEYHYNSGLLFIVNKLNIDGRRLFYNVFKNHSTSGTIRPYLTSFETWNEYLDTNWNQVDGYKERTLKSFFKGSGIKELDCNYYLPDASHDFYGNEYTTNFTADRYITEATNSLTASLINGINILKSDAGTGKSTWFEELVLGNINKNIIVISVKKVLLNQQSGHYDVNKEIEKNFQIHKCYDSHQITLQQNTGNIIFTTINSLHKIIKNKQIEQIDLILFDEAHLLVDYSNIDEEENGRYIDLYRLLPTNITQIYASATPEKFVNSLLGLSYNYINVDVAASEKIGLNVIYTNTKEEKLYDLLKLNSGCTNNLVYINNKQDGKIIADYLSEHKIVTDTELLNRDTQYDYTMTKIVQDELLLTGITYIATSYVSEGINFLNDEKFNVYYIDNHTTSVDNLYQLVNRFRRKILGVFYLTNQPKEYKSIVDKDYIHKIKNPKKDELKEKRKRVYHNNIDKFNYSNRFQEIYNSTENLQKLVDTTNWNKNYIKTKTLCDHGKLIDRFYIGYQVDKEGDRYIKTNKDYFECLLHYYFKPKFSRPEYNEKKTGGNKVADYEIRNIYNNNSELLDLIFSSKSNHKKNKDEAIEFLFEKYSNNSDPILEDPIDIETILNNENILKRISKQNQKLLATKADYKDLGIDIEIAYNLKFESSIKFEQELFKLKSELILMQGDSGNQDEITKNEYNTTVELIEQILKSQGYIEASRVDSFLKRNQMVVGLFWKKKLVTQLDLKSSRKKINGKTFRTWRINKS